MAEAAIVFEHDFSELVVQSVLKILLPHQYELVTRVQGQGLISQITINGENYIWLDSVISLVTHALEAMNVETTTVNLDN